MYGTLASHRVEKSIIVTYRYLSHRVFNFIVMHISHAQMSGPLLTSLYGVHCPCLVMATQSVDKKV